MRSTSGRAFAWLVASLGLFLALALGGAGALATALQDPPAEEGVSVPRTSDTIALVDDFLASVEVDAPRSRGGAKRLNPVAGVVATVENALDGRAPRQSFAWPIEGAVNTSFGGGHNGIDIEAEMGDPIRAARAGEITFAGDDGDGYGVKVSISHGHGLSTLYAHLSSITVSEGWVAQGQVIGLVGCTGSCTGDHLHFEILENGGPRDPLGYLP